MVNVIDVVVGLEQFEVKAVVEFEAVVVKVGVDFVVDEVKVDEVSVRLLMRLMMGKKAG